MLIDRRAMNTMHSSIPHGMDRNEAFKAFAYNRVSMEG